MSIRQDVSSDLLPDFRNLGVIARVLVAVNALALAGAIYATPALGPALEHFAQAAAFFEPLLLLQIACLHLLSPWRGRLPYGAAAAAFVALCAALTAGYHAALAALGVEIAAPPARSVLLSALIAAGLLAYFRLLTKAYSPALAEARLQALQARIRPHFLFNSLNAVLSLIRRDAKRAERTLENLADLFRTLLADARAFVRLADEIALLERYAEIEQLRLGDRLRVTWELDAAPTDALLPPLVLQPLLENAVYHGVEPGVEGGEIVVRIERRGDRVLAAIENPYHQNETHHAGNRMAFENIRERLALFFDAEARVSTRIDAGRYRVEIEMPYRTTRP